jgi:hypothetical protein
LGRGDAVVFDFKKEYREFYLPGNRPEIVDVPPVNYIAVRGAGDPNEVGGAYQQAIGILYAVAYTIKMSYKSGHSIEGFFDYVVPPLEGFWRQDGEGDRVDYTRKDAFSWISVIRLPDFVTGDDFAWAAGEASRKKKLDCSGAEYLMVHEGLCVQAMHTGSYDDEPATIAVMDDYIRRHGYIGDMTGDRLHHEIYLSDPRRVEAAKRRTVIRRPIRFGRCQHD